MTRPTDGEIRRVMDALVTGGEIASMLGVTQSAVSNWTGTREVGFPEPAYAFNERFKLYRREDVLHWYAERIGQDELRRQLERARAMTATLEELSEGGRP